MELQDQQEAEEGRLEGRSRVSCRLELQGHLKGVRLEEKEKLPSGWSFKISGRLKGFGRKERQELPSGWSAKDRGMLRLEWSAEQRR